VVVSAADQAGGPGGWGALLSEQIRQHGRLFYRLAYGVLGDAGAAEDACQQALLKAWEQRDRVQAQQGGAALRGWLARVVVNESLQAARRRKTELRANAARTQADAAAPAPAPRHEQADLRKAVLAALEHLPETPRLVVALRVMQDMSGNEVKDLLGCSAAEVSRQLHHGMELLRPLLADWKTSA
jgi:RNA polymerase sigma-70 factor (ECF subfamily)